MRSLLTTLCLLFIHSIFAQHTIRPFVYAKYHLPERVELYYVENSFTLGGGIEYLREKYTFAIGINTFHYGGGTNLYSLDTNARHSYSLTDYSTVQFNLGANRILRKNQHLTCSVGLGAMATLTRSALIYGNDYSTYEVDYYSRYEDIFIVGLFAQLNLSIPIYKQFDVIAGMRLNSFGYFRPTDPDIFPAGIYSTEFNIGFAYNFRLKQSK